MDVLVTIENTWGDYEYSNMGMVKLLVGAVTILIISLFLSKLYYDNNKEVVSTGFMLFGAISFIIILLLGFDNYTNYVKENVSIAHDSYESGSEVNTALSDYLGGNNIDPIVFKDAYCSHNNVSDNFILCGGNVGSVIINDNDNVPVIIRGLIERNSDDNIDLLIYMISKPQ